VRGDYIYFFQTVSKSFAEFLLGEERKNNFCAAKLNLETQSDMTIS
jgi:hypothetical protein